MSLILLLYSQLQASDYYVDQNHSDANDANSGTMASPWKTIAKANESLNPGDKVIIKSGTYRSYIAPDKSGTSQNRITYQNFEDDIVIIQDAPYGIYLYGKSFVSISGIKFYNLDKFLWLAKDADYNIISYCTFDHGRNVGWSGSKIYKGSSNNWIHHCQFSRYGYFTDDDIGSVIDIGTEEDTTDETQYNLIEDSHFYSGGHHVFGLHGRWNVVRNNIMHNEEWYQYNGTKYGNRVLYITGASPTWGENIIEGNRIGYSGDPSDNDGATTFLLAGNLNIVRKNDIYRSSTVGISLSCGFSYPVAPSYNYIYHNNLFDNGQDELGGKDECGIYFNNYGHPESIEGNIIKNNIFHSNGLSSKCAVAFSGVEKNAQILLGNWEEGGDPKFKDITGTDPKSVTNPDFTLQSSSPCIDKGEFLTIITSATGSGESFTVKDARNFTDGHTVVSGDEIQLSGSVQRATITKVDYENNTIIVDRNLEWKEGQGVSLAYENAAPDIGSHEYNSVSLPSTPKKIRIVIDQ